MSAAVIGVVLLLALGGMLLAWRLRGRRQRGLALPAAIDPGAEVASADGLYLATTFAGRPLDRVVAHGLGFRARGRVAVTERGVVLVRDGAADLVLPAAAITGAGRATWTIDRSVERDGLLVLAWRLVGPDGPVPVESSLRVDAAGQTAVIAAVEALVHPSEVPRADA